MTDISKITLPDNTTYNIKDKNARNFTNTPYYEQDEEALMFQLGESYMTGEQDNQPYLFRAAGGSADIGNREYDKIVGGTVAWNQLVRDEASTNETDFADIVTVDDAVEDAAGVKVKIEPVQDLHGYDHPWPAGGGVNKLKPNLTDFNLTTWLEYNEITEKYTIKQGTGVVPQAIPIDYNIPANTEITVTVFVESGQYINDSTISIGGYYVKGTERSWQGFVNLPRDTNLAGKTYTKTVTTTAELNSFEVFIYHAPTITTNIVFRAQIELGTNNSPTWHPYSNICPITGWDGVKVTRTGKNLLNDADARMNNASWWIGSVGTNDIPDGSFVLKAGTYTLSASDVQSGFYIIDETGARIDAAYNKTSITFTISKDQPIKISLYKANTTIDYWSTVNIQLELSDTVTDYEPYQGETYDITFPTSAGTVYGGELTVNEDGTGSLVVDRINAQLTGTALSASWNVADENRDSIGFYTNKANWVTNTGLPEPVDGGGVFDYCHIDAVYASDNWWAARFLFTNGLFNRFEMRIPKNVLTTPNTSGAKAYLNEHPLQVVYKIAPQTYTLTAPEIRTLLGENNIWADTGNLALTYTGTDEHLTLESGRKYLTRISGTDFVLLGSGQEITVKKGTNNVFDLTQMFGSTIADYIYSLETATPGAGVAWFRKLFPKPYYEYNPGELMSVQAVAHKLVGFNAWDEEWELGIINTTTGEETDSNSNIRSKNYIRVIPGATYYFKLGTTDISNNIVFYDAEKNYVAASGEHVNDVFTVPEDAHYMKFYMSTNYGRTYLSNICINLSGNGERNGEYEEYNMHSYPLDSSLILRGIPKLDANNQLYYDGDTYEADGTVTRRFKQIVLDGVNQSFTGSWGVIEGGYGVYKTIADIRSRALILTDKFINFFQGYNYMPIWSVGGNNGKSTSVTFKFPSTITSLTDANNWLKTNNVTMIYPVANPTTETAEPYDNPQIVASEGTEEYITTNIVFVGHETKY